MNDMTRPYKSAAPSRGADTDRPARCLTGAVLCALIVIVGVLERPASGAGADPTRVAGRWQRRDGGYVLELRNPAFDGGLTAAYFNPKQIHVSRSGWALKDGHVWVLVELRDAGYPGSTYTLAYQEDSDRLVGIYFQAAARQQFEVVFQRTE